VGRVLRPTQHKTLPGRVLRPTQHKTLPTHSLTYYFTTMWSAFYIHRHRLNTVWWARTTTPYVTRCDHVYLWSFWTHLIADLVVIVRCLSISSSCQVCVHRVNVSLPFQWIRLLTELSITMTKWHPLGSTQITHIVLNASFHVNIYQKVVSLIFILHLTWLFWQDTKRNL